MTNKEAIELLKKMPIVIVHAGYKEVIDIAIEALNCSEMPNNSDCISRQAAIDASCTCYDGVHCNHYPCKDVQAIMDLPSAQPEPCEDAVSRRRLLSDLKELTAAWGKYPVMEEQIKGVETAIGYVETIPSVTPERKRGKWIEEDDGWDGVFWRCSECNEPFYLVDGTPVDNEYHYCPNCGADMRGEQDDR